MPIILIVLGFLCLIPSHLFFQASNGSSTVGGNFSNLGQYLSGTAGLLFSLAGVILFYTSLTIQRQELALQRIELRKTQETLAAQKDEMAKQNEAHAKAQFDNRFFNMLKLLVDLRASFDINAKDENSLFQSRISHLAYRWIKNQDQQGGELANSTLNFYYGTYSSYFSAINAIINLVSSNSILKVENHEEYYALLLATLSNNERSVIHMASLATNVLSASVRQNLSLLVDHLGK